MQSFTKHTGIVAALDRVNVDTDQIIPKQFLKAIERTGFGKNLFFDWRFREDGSLNPDFELNQPRFHDATTLLTRANFGCGSSREHAPWALMDYGFCCLIAPSFADIFYNNCLKNGLLPVRLTEQQIEELFRRTFSQASYRLTVDLEACQVRDENGLTLPFLMNEFSRECLLKGLDDIGMTLQLDERICAYERDRNPGPKALAGHI